MNTKTKVCKQCGKEFTIGYNVTKEYFERRRFCSHKCSTDANKGKRYKAYGKALVPLEDRFWSKVERRSRSACWNWVGAKSVQGYGYLANTRRQGMVLAHRLSFQLHHGEIPDGMFVCHKCDNRRCVNPDHLFLGTAADNNRDRNQKGRTNKMMGETNHKSKLTEMQVIEIRSIVGRSQQSIADEYGVSQVTISKILLNKLWPDI